MQRNVEKQMNGQVLNSKLKIEELDSITNSDYDDEEEMLYNDENIRRLNAKTEGKRILKFRKHKQW